LFYFQGRPQGDLEGPKAPYVKKGKPIKDLAAVVDYIKPTVLLGKRKFVDTFVFLRMKKNDRFLGASGVARLFHEGVLKKMAAINERPVIFALYASIDFGFRFYNEFFVG